MKQPNQCYNHFQAHSNSVFTLNWHPEDKYWLATGGRDYFIKVWDTCVKGQPIHTIQTISAVHRLKWRPNHKYHVARLELVNAPPGLLITKTVASFKGASYHFLDYCKNVFKKI